MRTLAIACLASLLLASFACAPSFEGPEKVTGLRVLAVRAEPPEISASGQAPWPPPEAGLASLIGHPGFAAGDDAVRALVLHLACTPTPGDPLGTVCTQISALSDPAALLQPLTQAAGAACTAQGAGVVNGISISGLEACNRRGCGQLSVQRDPADPGSLETFLAARYRLPDGFWDGLDPGNPQRITGVDVVDLALAVEADPADVAPAQAAQPGCENVLPGVLGRFLVLWQQRAHVPSLKWLHVRGPDAPTDPEHDPAQAPNLNPQVVGIRLGAADLPPVGAGPQRLPAGSQGLTPDLGGDFQALRQSYQRHDTAGALIDTRQETWAYSWFATAGDLDQSHTDSSDPGNSYQPKGAAVLWLVVRDLRGGEAWTAAEVETP